LVVFIRDYLPFIFCRYFRRVGYAVLSCLSTFKAQRGVKLVVRALGESCRAEPASGYDWFATISADIFLLGLCGLRRFGLFYANGLHHITKGFYRFYPDNYANARPFFDVWGFCNFLDSLGVCDIQNQRLFAFPPVDNGAFL
jgi:hypothetical protein